MAAFNARVIVKLKTGVLDPQGKAIEGALDSLGFAGIESVRQGKVFDVVLEAESAEVAKESLTAMCEKLLANVVIESYEVTVQ